MEGMFLDPQSLPVLGSIIGGILLFAMAVGAVVYGWFAEEQPKMTQEHAPLLKKAA
jgi:hypothetical protein